MKKTKHTEARGGARPGAGRKPAGTVRMQIKPLADTAARLRAPARAENNPPGQIIDALL